MLQILKLLAVGVKLKKHNILKLITGKKLHDDFKEKHGKIPDDWIKEKK